MTVLQFLPRNGAASATVDQISCNAAHPSSSPTTGCGKRTTSPGGSSVVNKSKAPLRPRGRGRRINSTSPRPPPRHVPFPFLKLPAEVRNQVYGCLLTFDNPLHLLDHEAARTVRKYGRSEPMPNENFTIPPALREWTYDAEGHAITQECEWVQRYKQENLDFISQSLLLVNKQVYSEARGVLLANNALSFMPMDLNAMTATRWNTMRHFTRYVIGTDIHAKAMPTMVDFLTSTAYELRSLKFGLVIPGVQQTRCQYWVKKVKETMEPLRGLKVTEFVGFMWIIRYLVDNPEVRREMVGWLEELGRDIVDMGGRSIVTDDEETEVEDVVAGLVGSFPNVAVAPVAVATPAVVAPVVSA